MLLDEVSVMRESSFSNSTVGIVPLTRGQAAVVDIEDITKLTGYNWFAKWDEKLQRFYAMGVKQTEEGREVVWLHRLVLGIVDPSVEVDHRDRDTLNCCKYNLRRCSHAENVRNRGRFKNNTSGYKGVGPYGKPGMFRSRIRFNGVLEHLGVRDSAEEAAYLYDKRAKELFGEFAALNFPEVEQQIA